MTPSHYCNTSVVSQVWKKALLEDGVERGAAPLGDWGYSHTPWLALKITSFNPQDEFISWAEHVFIGMLSTSCDLQVTSDQLESLRWSNYPRPHLQKKNKFPQEGWEEASVLEEQDGHAEALCINVKAEFSSFSLTTIASGKYAAIAEGRVNILDC